MPSVSTGVESCWGWAARAALTTIVGTRPPPEPPLMPDVSLFDSSQVMTILPPAWYQGVACTCGMRVDRKESPCWTVPRSSSLVRFGVYHTKSGALAPLRSDSIDEESTVEMWVFGKYGHGLWITSYWAVVVTEGSVGRLSMYALA